MHLNPKGNNAAFALALKTIREEGAGGTQLQEVVIEQNFRLG